MREKKILFFVLLIILLTASSVSAQKKLPSKIEDGFVLEFAAPFERIVIQTNEKNMPNPESAEIFITAQTRLKNHKGKPVTPDAIRAGMEIEIELDKTNFTRLTASQIKLRTNLEERKEEIDGYLDRVEDSRAMVEGRVVELAPNTILLGTKDWKGKIYKSFGEIPLGSLVNLKGIRQKNRVIVVTRGEVRPNLFTPLEAKLVETVKQGLTVPPPDKPGAGVRIGNLTYKVVEDLDVNTYVNKVGMRVVPKFLRMLPPEDPNKVVFRFYVLEDETPNAAAFSDGSVFISTGLLKRLENEAQLAIILGHEIAHVTNEHVRRRFEAQQNQAFWAGMIAAGASVLGEQTALLIGKLSYTLMSNKFSNDMEEQADRVGLFYAYDAGYDVRESTNLWRKVIGSYREGVTGSILYSDHPAMLDRLKDMRREVILNYGDADFRETIVGREKFVEAVGVYFGWIQPKPTVVQANNSNKSNKKIPTKTQKSPVKNKTANVGDGFKIFFAKFKKAVTANNRTAIKNMMSPRFEWALDGYISRDEAFKLLDEMKLWAGLRNSVLRTPVKCKQPYCNNRAGYRVWSSARYKMEIMFEKDTDGNWYWTALLGD